MKSKPQTTKLIKKFTCPLRDCEPVNKNKHEHEDISHATCSLSRRQTKRLSDLSAIKNIQPQHSSPIRKILLDQADTF